MITPFFELDHPRPAIDHQWVYRFVDDSGVSVIIGDTSMGKFECQRVMFTGLGGQDTDLVGEHHRVDEWSQVEEYVYRHMPDVEREFVNRSVEATELGLKEIEAGNFVSLDVLEALIGGGNADAQE